MPYEKVEIGLMCSRFTYKKILTIGMITGCLFNHLPYKTTLSLVLKQYDMASPEHNDSKGGVQKIKMEI